MRSKFFGFTGVIATGLAYVAGTWDAFSTKMCAVFANLQRFARGEQPCNVAPELNEVLNGRYALKDNSPNGS